MKHENTDRENNEIVEEVKKKKGGKVFACYFFFNLYRNRHFPDLKEKKSNYAEKVEKLLGSFPHSEKKKKYYTFLNMTI